MRTTINLPDGLGEQAKAQAAREGRTFTSLVEEGLRTVLAQPGGPPDEAPPLPTYGNPGRRPLVALEDREGLWNALDADGPR